MSDRPALLLAMAPPLTRELFRADQLERLGQLCDLLAPEPLAEFDTPEALRQLGRCEILLSGWGCPRLDTSLLANAPALRAVIHAAGTVKNHVTPECFERGIRVSSAAAANAVPVAEFTLAAILFSAKRVFRLQRRYAELRSFRLWPAEFPGLGNYRKRIGIVGASRIGRRVIELLQPFDHEVWVYDPFLDDAGARELGARLASLDELLAQSDVVSLHCPLLPETTGLIDRARLARLRDGTVLINTARGALVDQQALCEELESGRIDAVIDTTEPEILPKDSPLYELPNVFLTPHVAGAMGPETQRMAELAIDEIERWVRGEALLHEVQPSDWDHIA